MQNSIEEDLLFTNKYTSTRDSRTKIDPATFKKFLGARNSHAATYSVASKLDLLELEKHDPDKDSILVGARTISRGAGGGGRNRSNKKLKRTIVTVDSRNRTQSSTLTSKQHVIGYPVKDGAQIGIPISTFLPKNPFISSYQNTTMLIHAPNHGIKDDGKTQLIFKGLDPNFNYKKTGIFKSYIEFDEKIGGPIFTISKIILKDTFDEEGDGTKIYHSDYFEIDFGTTALSININNIKASVFGGDLISIYILGISTESRYPSSNHYKINLGRSFTSVYMVRLVSIELPNTSYTINSIRKTTSFGRFSGISTEVNNILKWINQEDFYETFNMSLYADNVFLNTIDEDKLSQSTTFSLTRSLEEGGLSRISDRIINNSEYNCEINGVFYPEYNQISYADKVWCDINASTTIQKEYSKISSKETVISGQGYGDFRGTDFYSPRILHTCITRKDIDIDNGTSDQSYGYWLENTYHNIGKTLIYNLQNELTIDDNLSKLQYLKSNNVFLFNYFNRLINTSTDETSIFNDPKTIGLSEDNIGIPSYMGYFTIHTKRNEGINYGLITNEYIELTDLESEYIFPCTSFNSEKFLAPVLVPDKYMIDIDTETLIKSLSNRKDAAILTQNITDEISLQKQIDIISKKESPYLDNFKLRKQKRFPIYEELLVDGRYSKKSFVNMMQKVLKNSKNKQYDASKQLFKISNMSPFKKFLGEPPKTTLFKISIVDSLNKIDIRQYRILENYKEKTEVNPNIIYYNQSIPYIFIKSSGIQVKMGDIIRLENFSKSDNIPSSEINKEHKCYVMPSFKAFLRIIHPLPSTVYLDQDKYFNEIIGENITLSEKANQLALKRDLRKFLILSDKSVNISSDIPCYDFKFIGNKNNTVGNSTYSNKETYPINFLEGRVYYEDEINPITKSVRNYGQFTHSRNFKFGIYGFQDKSLSSNEETSFLNTRSASNLSDGALISKLEKDGSEKRREGSTFSTNINYLGSKLINSVNNEKFYPEYYPDYRKNEIDTKGVQLSLLKYELFVKLNDIKSIDSKTIIGRITSIINDSRPDNNGNYSFTFDLLTDVKLGNFKQGDIIIGLDSNCISMFVPETWNYDGLPNKEVLNSGIGTYMLEKYRDIYPFKNIIDKAIGKVTDTGVDIAEDEDAQKFAKNFNNWGLERIENSNSGFYVKINTVPITSQLNGKRTKDAEVYKPIKYKFLFDETSPFNRLNMPANQEFDYNQSNFVPKGRVNIINSYLSGLYTDTISNHLIIESNEATSFLKNDKVFIQDHEIYGRYSNNLLNKVLVLEKVEPFRNYFKTLENVFTEFDIKEKPCQGVETETSVPFKNINIIYNYADNTPKICLGNSKHGYASSYSYSQDFSETFIIYGLYPPGSTGIKVKVEAGDKLWQSSLENGTYDKVGIVVAEVNKADWGEYPGITVRFENSNQVFSDPYDAIGTTGPNSGQYTIKIAVDATTAETSTDTMILLGVEQKNSFELYKQFNANHVGLTDPDLADTRFWQIGNNNIFGFKERLINWFFENPYLWNANDLEKVLEFKSKYLPTDSNKDFGTIELDLSSFRSDPGTDPITEITPGEYKDHFIKYDNEVATNINSQGIIQWNVGASSADTNNTLNSDKASNKIWLDMVEDKTPFIRMVDIQKTNLADPPVTKDLPPPIRVFRKGRKNIIAKFIVSPVDSNGNRFSPTDNINIKFNSPATGLVNDKVLMGAYVYQKYKDTTFDPLNPIEITATGYIKVTTDSNVHLSTTPLIVSIVQTSKFGFKYVNDAIEDKIFIREVSLTVENLDHGGVGGSGADIELGVLTVDSVSDDYSQNLNPANILGTDPLREAPYTNDELSLVTRDSSAVYPFLKGMGVYYYHQRDHPIVDGHNDNIDTDIKPKLLGYVLDTSIDSMKEYIEDYSVEDYKENNNILVSIKVLSGGKKYNINDVVVNVVANQDDSTGQNSSAIVTEVGSDGEILQVKVTGGGKDYQIPPKITFTRGNNLASLADPDAIAIAYIEPFVPTYAIYLLINEDSDLWWDWEHWYFPTSLDWNHHSGSGTYTDMFGIQIYSIGGAYPNSIVFKDESHLPSFLLPNDQFYLCGTTSNNFNQDLNGVRVFTVKDIVRDGSNSRIEIYGTTNDVSSLNIDNAYDLVTETITKSDYPKFGISKGRGPTMSTGHSGFYNLNKLMTGSNIFFNAVRLRGDPFVEIDDPADKKPWMKEQVGNFIPVNKNCEENTDEQVFATDTLTSAQKDDLQNKRETNIYEDSKTYGNYYWRNRTAIATIVQGALLTSDNDMGSLLTTTNALLGSITQNTTSITTGTHTGLTTTTNGNGNGVILTIVASGTTEVTGITLTTVGCGYSIGDTLTVAQANIPGADNDLELTLALDDFINNKKDYSIVSGHLDYFYKNFLQNKCVINYKQLFSKEEQFYLNNHQIIVENKELFINNDPKVNDYNEVGKSTSKFLKYENRNNEVNPGAISLHTFDYGDKIYLFNHLQDRATYNELSRTTSDTVVNMVETELSQKFNKQYTQETVGIPDSCYNIITNLWNGLINNQIPILKNRPGTTSLIDLEFDEAIEKGFLNKGLIRATGLKVNICGNNSVYYNRNIIEDAESENEALIINEVLPQTSSFTPIIADTCVKRGALSFILGDQISAYGIEQMFKPYDIIFIGTTIIGTRDTYQNLNDKINITQTTELGVIKSINPTTSEITLVSKLLNDHAKEELVISRYKYSELYSQFNIDDASVIDATKWCFKISKSVSGITGSLSDECISKGDIICIDWATKRWVQYIDPLSIPLELAENNLGKISSFNSVNIETNIITTNAHEFALDGTVNFCHCSIIYSRGSGLNLDPLVDGAKYYIETVPSTTTFTISEVCGGDSINLGVTTEGDKTENLGSSTNTFIYEDKTKFLYTQQFNRVIDVNTDHLNYFKVWVEKAPYIVYPTNSPIIIMKKGNNVADTNPEGMDTTCLTIAEQNSIKYTNIATQLFTVNNKWYTKIFYKGKLSINPTYSKTEDNEIVKKYLNDKIDNNWRQGSKCFNKWTSRKVYIEGMKGCEIPFMPIPCINNNFNSDLITESETYTIETRNFPFETTVIKPVDNGEYIIKPIIKDDYVNFVDLDSNNLDIEGGFKYNFEYLDKYDADTSETMGNITDNYKNRSLDQYWDDTRINGNFDGDTIAYNYIVIEGMYLGYGGYISERYSPSDNLINNVDGYTVLDTINTSTKHYVIIDLEERQLNLNIEKNTSNKLLSNFSSNSDKIPAELLTQQTIYDHIKDDLFKDSIKLGSGGSMFLKKLNAPLSLTSNDYLFLCIPAFSHIQDTSSNTTFSSSIFSKILLPGDSNKTLYNTHVGGNKVYNQGLLNIDKPIEIAFLTPSGKLFDFNGLDHSFTLEIYELVDNI